MVQGLGLGVPPPAIPRPGAPPQREGGYWSYKVTLLISKVTL